MNKLSSLFFLILCSTSLASCAGLTAPKSIKPNFVMSSDGPQKVGFRHPIPSSLIQQFGDDYSVAWCMSQTIKGRKFVTKQYSSNNKYGPVELNCNSLTIPVTPEVPTTPATPAVPVTPVIPAIPAVPATTATTTATAVTEKLAAKKMTKSGFRLMDSVCAAYFRRLGNQDQDLDFYSQSLNNVGTVVSAILGVTDADAKAVAITGTMFGAGQAGLESFDEIYHFSPDLQAVGDMVSRAGKTYETGLFNDKPPADFYDAVKAVEDYQRICQTSNIRALVNQAIVKSEISATPRTSRNRLIKNVPSGASINTLMVELATTSISSETLAWLSAGATGLVSASDLPKLSALLTQAGIAKPDTKFSKVRIWLDDLSISEPNAYENLLNRVGKLDPSALPAAAINSTNDATRKNIIEAESKIKPTKPSNSIGPVNPFVQ